MSLNLVFGMHQLVMNYYEFHKQIKHVIHFALLEMEKWLSGINYDFAFYKKLFDIVDGMMVVFVLFTLKQVVKCLQLMMLIIEVLPQLL